MVLVDSSVWIAHLRMAERTLLGLIDDENVGGHPFVVGEVALGHLHARPTMMELLRDLPQALIADDDEVFKLIERHRLFGRGVGYVDCHLLASARISDAQIWSRDRRLMTIAAEMGIAFVETTH